MSTLTSKEIDVIRAWMQTQWERIPATPHSQPGSYARGYDGGMVDILRGLQATLDKLPPAHETCEPHITSGMRCYVCQSPGDNIASDCREVYLEDDGHKTVYVGPTCFKKVERAGSAGLASGKGRGPRVFFTFDQAAAHAQKAEVQRPANCICAWKADRIVETHLVCPVHNPPSKGKFEQQP